MKDSELRGMVLQKYYDKRKDFDFCMLTSSDFNNLIPTKEVTRISQQLAEQGLISGEVSAFGEDSSWMGGITAYGVDVIEDNAPAPISIQIDNSQHDITVSHVSSGNIQIGNGNTNIHDIGIAKLINAINNSGSPTYEIEEAKSMVEKLLNLPLVKKVMGKIIPKGD